MSRSGPRSQPASSHHPSLPLSHRRSTFNVLRIYLTHLNPRTLYLDVDLSLALQLPYVTVLLRSAGQVQLVSENIGPLELDGVDDEFVSLVAFGYCGQTYEIELQAAEGAEDVLVRKVLIGGGKGEAVEADPTTTGTSEESVFMKLEVAELGAE